MRRGNETLNTIVGVVLLLILLAWSLYFFYTRAINPTQKVGDCIQEGGACVTTWCDQGQVSSPQWSCPGIERCCTNLDGTPVGGSLANGQNPAANVATIQAPQISLRNDKTNLPVSSGSTITFIPGTSAPFVLTLNTYANKTGSCNDPNYLCDYQWKKRIIVQGPNDELLYDWYTVQGPTGITIKDGNGVQNPQNPMLKITHTANDKTQTTGIIIQHTSLYDLAPNFGTNQVGQTFKMTITVYPGDNYGDRPDLEQQYVLNVKVTSGVTFTMADKWENSKQVVVTCDQKIVVCDDSYYEVISSTDPKGCPMPADVQQTVATKPITLSTQSTQYCISDGKNNLQCGFSSEGACRAQLASLQEPTDYLNAISPIMAALNKNQQVIDQWWATFDAQQSIYANKDCYPQKQVMTTTGSPGVLYRADSFDKGAQRGTFTLDQKFEENQMLCVYGQNANTGKMYFAGSKKIMLDVTPPTVQILFSPLTLKMTFVCNDELSGCKSSVGVAYIGETAKFLSAMMSAPQSAATWCPKSGYSVETRSQVTYTNNELRILCMQGTDNAGNTAVTMTKVYNGYDMLAKAIMLAQGKT